MLAMNDDNFDETVRNNQILLVDFFAPWCRPCHALVPTLEGVAAQMPDVAIGKLNIDENPETTAKFAVGSIPTLIFFKDGKEAKRMIGLQDAKSLSDTLQALK